MIGKRWPTAASFTRSTSTLNLNYDVIPIRQLTGGRKIAPRPINLLYDLSRWYRAD